MKLTFFLVKKSTSYGITDFGELFCSDLKKNLKATFDYSYTVLLSWKAILLDY